MKNYTVYKIQDRDGKKTNIDLYECENFDINQAFKKMEELFIYWNNSGFIFEVKNRDFI